MGVFKLSSLSLLQIYLGDIGPEGKCPEADSNRTLSMDAERRKAFLWLYIHVLYLNVCKNV